LVKAKSSCALAVLVKAAKTKTTTAAIEVTTRGLDIGLGE